MKKIFRKITALLVALVLICLCGVNAFAASITEDYDNRRYIVTASYSISRYATEGSLLVTRSGTPMWDADRSVSVTYRYIVMDGNTPVVKIGTKTDEPTYALSAIVSFSNTSIYQMVNATYTFEANIPCSYGTQQFRPAPQTITYQP